MNLGVQEKSVVGSEELDEFSLEHAEVQAEPVHQWVTRFQAPRSSGVCHPSDLGLKEPSHRQ